MADGLEKFLKYVQERSKEMNGGIHPESGGDDCENLLSELLLRGDLLGKAVQLLHKIGNISSLDYQDKMGKNSQKGSLYVSIVIVIMNSLHLR